ncbi:Rieske domain-containing protein [Ilyonectria sp. MPI-CAGE-AT-0026]|nr:Rieske domain-containing protein [Ilyonectria sp. MPI-CAGE-AT-0026]
MADSGVISNINGTLPASWYREPAMFELEKRAIFSNRWLLVSHRLRFETTGEFINFDVAGMPILIIRDRKMELKAFHNVCRHRAYPVVEKESGKASILACKYHGWSYGLSGNLAKAPRFDTVNDFDKSQFSLFPVHLHVDKLGFVWINLDAACPPSTSWEEHFKGIDEQERLAGFNMDDYKFDHTWELEGAYNWKTIMDNYNECYHCLTAHSGIAATLQIDTYDVRVQKGWIEHLGEPKERYEEGKFGVQPSYVFPSSTITPSDDYAYLLRVMPTSSTTCKMVYEVYRLKSASDESFEEIDAFFKQVEREDKGLCDAAQRNLNTDTYVAGPLHPQKEKGVMHVKKLVKEAIEKHLAAERAQGVKINPSKRVAVTSVSEEETLCKLVCDGNEMSAGIMAW